MFISEITFPHLQAEHEAQLTRELERRRVVNERLDGQGADGATIARSSRSSRKARPAATAARQRGGELTGSTWASTLKA